MGFLALRRLIVILAVFSGCGGLRLQERPVVDDTDWPTFARTATRTGNATSSVTPPLSKLWEHDVTSGVGNGSPIVIDSFLILGNLRGELHAINIRTGKRVGWIDIGDAINGTPVYEAGIAYIPISNSDESLVAFDLNEGKAIWKRNYGDIEVSPLLLDNRLYIGNTRGAFFCVDAQSGDQLWKFELEKNTTRKGIRSSPSSDGAVVVFGADDGVLYALDAQKGLLQWSVNSGSAIMASPCIAEGIVFVGNTGGAIIAVNVHDGSARWKHETGASVYSTPALIDDRVILGTTAGQMIAIHRHDGTVAWSTDVGGVVNASAAISGQTVFVGTLKKEFLALDVATGTVLWRETVPGRIKSSPALSEGRIFIATDEKLVLAFGEARK